MAKKRGVSPTQIALAWLLSQPSVTTLIFEASQLEHLEEAIASVELKLDNDEPTSLEQLYKPHPILGHR